MNHTVDVPRSAARMWTRGLFQTLVRPFAAAACRRLLMLALVACLPGPVFAQTTFEIGEPEEGSTANSSSSYSSGSESARQGRSRRGAPKEGFGIQARGGHIAGDAVGRDISITPLELFPFYLMDSSLIFSDMRLFINNEGRLGGNAGLGYRYFHSGFDRIFGASFWFDVDNTTTDTFQQLGLSLESYGQIIDFRSNYYFPVGNTSRQTGLVLAPGSARFFNNNVLYDQIRVTREAMQGMDMEVGVPIPGRWSEDRNVRAYAGWYHFDGDYVEEIWGWKTRLQGNLLAALDVHVEVSNDTVYNTQVSIGGAWTFGRLHRSKMMQTTTLGRIGEHVTRNYNVVAPKQRRLERDIVAVNPETGDAYVVRHVSTNGGGTDSGTVENPYDTLAEAIAAGGDIIFVHADSVFTGADASVALDPGMRLLGEGNGVDHYIQVPRLGNLLLPRATSGTSRPEFRNSVGDSITLASGSEFSGFHVLNSSGRGIVGSGINNVTLRNVSVTSSTGAGVYLENLGGTSLVQNLTVNNSVGNGLDVRGLTGRLDFLGTTTVANAFGTSINLEGLGGNSVLTFDDVTIAGRNGIGIRVDNADGLIEVQGTTSINNSTSSAASAIDIRNSEGDAVFGVTHITDAGGNPAIYLENNDGLTGFQDLNVTTTAGAAVYASNAGRLGILDGTISSKNGAAFEIDDTELDVTLESVSVDGGTVGIQITDSAGRFLVVGNQDLGTGGTIKNTDTAVILQNAGNVGLAFMNFENNGLGIDVESTNHLELFGMQIKNSTSYAIDSLNTKTLVVNSSLFENNGTSGSGSIRALVGTTGAYNYQIVQSTILDAMGDAVSIGTIAGGETANLSFTFQGNNVETSHAGSTGLKLGWGGPMTANISDNIFLGTGGSTVGIDVTNTSATSLADITIARNNIAASGGNSTGIRMVTSGPSRLRYDANVLEFLGTSNTGAEFTLAGSTELTLVGNRFLDRNDGGTGFLFNSVTGPANITLNANSLSFANQGGLADRGIIFSAVGGTGDVRLFGTQNNQVSGAGTVFFAPPGALRGGFYLNGSPFFVP